MQKPNETKQLALYAAVCAGVCILIEAVIAVMPNPFIRLFGSGNLELPGKWSVLLLLLILIRFLPLGCAAVWSFVSRTISHGTALATVILAPVLYVGGLLAGSGSSFLMSRMISREGAEVFSAFHVTQSTMNLFSILGTAALVLLCCAGAIELYITTHTPSEGAISNM